MVRHNETEFVSQSHEMLIPPFLSKEKLSHGESQLKFDRQSKRKN